jgi:prevent-host-death family protein
MKMKLPLYRQRKPALKLMPESSGPMVMREVATMPGVGPIISVRAAKAHLSALLELVAGGREITITSDGEPKAVLSPVKKNKARKVFTGMGDYLMKQPVHRGSADEALNWTRGEW